MYLKAVLIFTAALGIACSNTMPENYSSAKSADKLTPAETSKEKKSSENECRICDYDFSGYKGELTKAEVDGLLLALNDEYLAISVYKGVNEKFDNPRPFVNIIKAEERHAKQLIAIFDRYQIPVPENPWIGEAPKIESVSAACKEGIEAEIVNMKLYDDLFKSTDREDILFVYKNLQRASAENHKPAFERCAVGDRSNGNGRGIGRGRQE